MRIQKIILFLLTPLILSAHGSNAHESKIEATKKVIYKTIENINTYKQINESYIKDIKPIFKAKCFDCHAKLSQYPWYYQVPGIKQLIDYDMTEAKEHLDMSNDFPFISHESPLKDLQSLQEIGENATMPPFRYILGHWDSSLTTNEKEKLIQWTRDSIEKLKAKN